MKQFSNFYIFCFSSVLVLLVALALSYTSLSLSDKQNENVEIERKQNLLAALGVNVPADQVQGVYSQYIKSSLVLKSDGTVVPNQTADLIDMKAELARPASERNLPLYEATKDGKPYFIIPVRGAGLWGPIWGDVALAGDLNTIAGVSFDHKGETPGLGAEIATPKFQEQFLNKTLFDGHSFISVKVEKKGTYVQDGHTVDAISGGTITSKSLERMIRECIEPYQKYFANHKMN